MNQDKIQMDPESGRVLLVREPNKRTCLWQALCAVAVLGLVAVTSYLLLSQMRVLPTQQDESGGSEPAAERFKASNDLEQFMKQVGGAERAKIAAHLTASPTIRGKDVVWQKDTDSTFTEGVDFENNGLVIKTPGQYFVYTQVVFHGKGCRNEATYLSHNVSSLSVSYPEENLLLKATKSVCHYGPHQQHWYKTSYQGAIFQFEEGDHIFSRVNEMVVRYVDSAQGKTFFGIFAL
ncbi:tumor necrosis factor-like [Pristis pectinata]|uniref:tumor necrosis factor-like n=1 Tax=Pristis pectinata TaxID=685728 RepID=UPI00223C950D|nr:tumor necrosis factor-like [Pristis pectinata]